MFDVLWNYVVSLSSHAEMIPRDDGGEADCDDGSGDFRDFDDLRDFDPLRDFDDVDFSESTNANCICDVGVEAGLDFESPPNEGQ